MKIADRSPNEPFVLVALIGEGQEIHAGEEAGIKQWIDAILISEKWQIFAPPHLAPYFRNAGLTVGVESLLNLTNTLRSHRASQTARWADLLVNGELDEASHVANELWEAGFNIYLSRDLETLRNYVRERYASDPGKRYGILVSSKFRDVTQYGIQPLRADYWHYGEWYEEGPSHLNSACSLKLAATEFGCQGLELDLPIVCWGKDFTWHGNNWVIKVGRSRYVINPNKIRRNAYRVLLTRGRDGLCIFVPQEPFIEMDSTYNALLKAGALPFSR